MMREGFIGPLGKKLVCPKNTGGLGFKDFMCFNLALLAKQAWRILNNPDDLWVRILKSIYFPNTDFLMDVKGARASWAWSSILEGRNFLAKDLCWGIGCNSRVQFWQDPGVPGLPGNKLSSSPPYEAFSDSCVAEFIINYGWDLSNVDCWLTEEEIAAIKSIPISMFHKDDSLRWNGAMNGMYTVKLGYKMAVSSMKCGDSDKPETSVCVDNDLWKAIWNLRSPPKIKHFIWRLCSNALATKENLWRRKCSPSPVCPCCNLVAESHEHLMVLCEWVKQVWFLSPFSFKFSENHISRLDLWLCGLLADLSLKDFELALIASI